MPANTSAPQGLLFSRNIISNSPTFQANIFAIQRGYASSIGIGDLVITGTGGGQGFVALSTGLESAQLGVFAGITSLVGGIGGAQGDGYYDINTQTYSYGLNGAYVPSITPPVGVNVGAKVISDPFAVYRAQLVGGAWSDAFRGQNVSFTAGTNGAPNASGMSTLSLDFASIANTNTLPFRIVGLAGVQGGPQDPTYTNPWIEVTLNNAEQLASAGV